jgi:hypothetical protein
MRLGRNFLNQIFSVMRHRVEQGRGEWGIGNLNFSVRRYFRLEPVG